MIKGLKSYVRVILGEEGMENFNDFEKGIIFMERSRLDQPLPPREDFLVALEYAEDGFKGLDEYSSELPKVIKQVGKFSIELLKMQLEVLDKYPEESDWTYRKSLECTKSDEDLCNRIDFLTGKLYQIMPLYTKAMEQEYIKNMQSNS